MDSQFTGVFTVGQTLDRGIRLYRKTFLKSVLLLLIPCIFMAIYMTKSLDFTGAKHNAMMAMFSVWYILSTILFGWGWIVTTRYIHQTSIGNTVTFGQMIKMASFKDLLYIFTYIIWVVAMVISMVALFIPFIYFMNIYSVGMIIYTVERLYSINGIKRTFALTKKRWWKTFAINLVTLVIILVPLFISVAIFGAAVAATAMQNPENLNGQSSNPMLFAGVFVYTGMLALLWPAFTSIMIVHYNSLKAEKEGSDISQQIQEISAATPATVQQGV